MKKLEIIIRPEKLENLKAFWRLRGQQHHDVCRRLRQSEGYTPADVPGHQIQCDTSKGKVETVIQRNW